MASQLKKTVMPSGGDYTSLEACMDANEQNLVTADKYFDVEIDGTWSSADTTAVVCHNYTTSSSCYINIYTTSTARHKGVYSTSYYLLYPSTDSMALNIDNNNDTSQITVKGLQVDGRNKTGTAGEGDGGCIHAAAYEGNVTIAYNLVRSTAYTGIDILAGRGSYTRIYNNIIYSSAKTAYANGICTYGSNATYIANNTVYGFYRQIYRGDAGVIKNNILMNGGSVAIYYTGATGSNNATYDSTADDGSLTTGMVNYTSYSDYFVSVTSGSEDFHLKAGSPFINQGVDASGDSAGITDDIDGVTRSGTWDIGADEYTLDYPKYTRQDIAALPAGDTDLSGAFSAQDYIDVASENFTYVDQTSVGQYADFLFKDQGTSQKTFTVTWKGKADRAPSTSRVVLQIYDRDGTTWEDLDEENGVGAGTDFTLTATVTSDLDHYYNADFVISCRVYQQAI